ncbi:MAG: large-conductance mechanosensitive channel protein MscL [Gemmatimonadales bacterium]
MLQEFKKFALRGNVVDMAVGIIIGGAFGTIVKSMVDDVMMPPLGFLLGNVDFSHLTLTLREAAGESPAVALRYGMFINNILSFLIVAFAVFLLVRTMNRLQRQEAAAPPPPSKKDCPFCYTEIALKATRCPHCTSDLKA